MFREVPLVSFKGNVPHKIGTETSEMACEVFQCDIIRNICTTFSIQCFECLKCFHVNFTDLSEEKTKTLGNINGCFWACLRCRTQVLIPQDEPNINDELSQKIEDIKNNLKSEIDSFKTEIRDCIINVQAILNSKTPET